MKIADILGVRVMEFLTSDSDEDDDFDYGDNPLALRIYKDINISQLQINLYGKRINNYLKKQYSTKDINKEILNYYIEQKLNKEGWPEAIWANLAERLTQDPTMINFYRARMYVYNAFNYLLFNMIKDHPSYIEEVTNIENAIRTYEGANTTNYLQNYQYIEDEHSYSTIADNIIPAFMLYGYFLESNKPQDAELMELI
jgi:hypothetical protein